MKLSMEWLGSMVQPDVSCGEYARAMTMSGSKVEKVEVLSQDIKNVVVGKLLSLSPHPDADRLQICDVDAGERLQIVTGAVNIKPGDLVPVALDSAELPGGVKIKTGKLRGVESQGMLCSYKELALTQGDVPGSDEDGILILGSGQPGEDIKKALCLEDTVLDFEITNNRPDCLSVIGLARETSAVFSKPFSVPAAIVKGEGQDIGALLSVDVEDTILCPRYSARMVTDVKIEPSPLWMRRRLRAAGIRPINNIVDITNYVMLEYGQPMHAFDFSCVSGSKIVVRRAKPGEAIETLDGQQRILDDDMLIIADKDKPIGVAGVMGGEGSGIHNETCVIVFESANFNGPSVRKTALKLAMRTDASSRFEKGLDIQGTVPALQRACELVEMLSAGTVCNGLIDKCSSDHTPRVIEFRPESINALLGTQIKAGDMLEYLSRIGCLPDGGGKKVAIPSWRSDLLETEDLAEEVARLYGYNNIGSSLTSTKSQGGKTQRQKLLDKLFYLCLSLGFNEMMTYAFIGPSDYDKVRLSPDRRASMVLLNPIGEDTSVMRSSALPSLMSVLERNNSARTPAVRFFEAALTYHPLENSLPKEKTVLIMGGYGLDFLELKGAVEAIFDHLHIEPVFAAFNGNPSYHPGRCAQITAKGIEVGIIGELHPETCDNYGITRACACELDFEAILPLTEVSIQYRPMTRFPSVTRDLALICEQAIPSGELSKHIRKCGGSLLSGCEIFDVYTGKPIPEGKKSVAFSLTFQSAEKTLTDKEVQQLINSILKGVEEKFSAILRF